MLQLIVGAGQALHVIALKQTCREIVGDVTKMLKRTGKWPQRGDLVSHLRKVSQIPFTDVLSCVLLGIGEDLLRLMHELVGVLQRWPQRRRGVQSFGEKQLQLL